MKVVGNVERTPPSMSESAPIVRVSEMTVSRNGITTLDKVDLTLRPGTITAVIGPNGAGKSTMIGAVLGLVPAQGSMYYEGTSCAFGSTTPSQIGCVLDKPLWHPRETGREFVQAMAQSPHDNRADVRDTLERVGASRFCDQRLGRMSLGMRQRIALAGALVNRPPVILMDEPTNGLDPVALLWLRRTLVEMAAEGVALLLSSHDLLPMTQIADDVLVVNRGRIIESGAMITMLGGISSGSAMSEDSRAGREVIVEANDVAGLDGLLAQLGVEYRQGFDKERWVRGVHWERMREEAARRNIVLTRLGTTTESLNDPVSVFARLIAEDNR